MSHRSVTASNAPKFPPLIWDEIAKLVRLGIQAFERLVEEHRLQDKFSFYRIKFRSAQEAIVTEHQLYRQREMRAIVWEDGAIVRARATVHRKQLTVHPGSMNRSDREWTRIITGGPVLVVAAMLDFAVVKDGNVIAAGSPLVERAP